MILITRPNGPGGVANYYNTLRPYLPSNVEYCFVHNPHAKTLLAKLISFPRLLFRYLLLLPKASVVCVNPSLDANSFYRDLIFLSFALLIRKRTVVFFRGWDLAYEKQCHANFWLRHVFRYTYAKADQYIVLGKVFQRKLVALGVPEDAPFYHETTVSSMNPLAQDKVKEKYCQAQTIQLLFMSRLVAGKGMDEAIAIFSALKDAGQDVALTIAGDGPEAERLHHHVQQESIVGIQFTGDIRGDKKKALMKRMHVLLFPTRYGEGLPNTILEAMANGLIIVTTPVGGIPDIVRDPEHGILMDYDNINVAVKRLIGLLHDRDTLLATAMRNRNKAEDFTAEAVVCRFMSILSGASKDGEAV